MKKIWIINHYAGMMYFNKGGRHYWFAKFLKNSGYVPVVFCCNQKHDPNGMDTFLQDVDVWKELLASEIQTPFVFVKSSPYSDNGKQRVWNMIQFYFNVKKAAKEYARENGKPDVILASSVHPLTMVAGLELAKYYGIKCICEVRDLWPESIVVYSKGFSKKDFLIKLLYLGEKWIYKKADALIFTMEGGYDYIRQKKWDAENGGPIDLKKVFHINNGIDLKAFDVNREYYKVEDEDLANNEIFKVVYTGSIRRGDNLGTLLDAAKLIKNKRVRFLLWGSGEEVDILKERVRKEKITNVVFKGSVGKEYVPYIVCKADVNFAHCTASPILRFGISLNKLFDYFAAGKPVLTDYCSKYDPVVIGRAGLACSEYIPQAIANIVDEASSLSQSDKQIYSENARRLAEQHDFEKLTERLLDVIDFCERRNKKV